MQKIEEKLKKEFPDAKIELRDYRHDGTHIVVDIVSSRFENLNLVDQHRLVYAALSDMLKSGEVHALKIKTSTREAKRSAPTNKP